MVRLGSSAPPCPNHCCKPKNWENQSGIPFAFCQRAERLVRTGSENKKTNIPTRVRSVKPTGQNIGETVNSLHA